MREIYFTVGYMHVMWSRGIHKICGFVGKVPIYDWFIVSIVVVIISSRSNASKNVVSSSNQVSFNKGGFEVEDDDGPSYHSVLVADVTPV